MKKIFALTLAIIMVLCLFTACGDEGHTDETKVQTKHNTDLAEVPGYDYLVYSTETGTVYYFIRTSGSKIGVGYMSPYIRNGHYCEYVDNEIVEVFPSVEVDTN